MRCEDGCEADFSAVCGRQNSTDGPEDSCPLSTQRHVKALLGRDCAANIQVSNRLTLKPRDFLGGAAPVPGAF